jgi:hypothetical protein
MILICLSLEKCVFSCRFGATPLLLQVPNLVSIFPCSERGKDTPHIHVHKEIPNVKEKLNN